MCPALRPASDLRRLLLSRQQQPEHNCDDWGCSPMPRSNFLLAKCRPELVRRRKLFRRDCLGQNASLGRPSVGLRLGGNAHLACQFRTASFVRSCLANAIRRGCLGQNASLGRPSVGLRLGGNAHLACQYPIRSSESGGRLLEVSYDDLIQVQIVLHANRRGFLRSNKERLVSPCCTAMSFSRLQRTHRGQIRGSARRPLRRVDFPGPHLSAQPRTFFKSRAGKADIDGKRGRFFQNGEILRPS